MQTPNYNVSVNGRLVLENAHETGLDFIQVDEHHYHVLDGEKSFLASLEKVDFYAKTFVFRINGEVYSIKIADQFDQMLEKLGLQANAGTRFKDVKAPMPGLVLDIVVEAGQEVKKGDALLILEAMKMENVIKSPGDGVVKKVAVEKGRAVNKNQILLEMQ